MHSYKSENVDISLSDGISSKSGFCRFSWWWLPTPYTYITNKRIEQRGSQWRRKNEKVHRKEENEKKWKYGRCGIFLSSMLMRRIVKIFYETDVESAQQCPGIWRQKNMKSFCSLLAKSIKIFPISRWKPKLFLRDCLSLWMGIVQKLGRI